MCVAFGVVFGISLGAGICAVTTFFVIPSLSTHIWTVVGITATVNGVGITVFAITTVRAVKDYRKKDSLITCIKEYDLEEFVHNLLAGDHYWGINRDYVLGIQSEDIPLFFNYLDTFIKDVPPKTESIAEFYQTNVHMLSNFIRERPDWEGELANAGFDEKLLQSLKEFVCPVKSKTEDV